jgi:UDP-glucose:(heptosyl)LPS alpha-1,3-glucosyltransferase
MKVALVILRVDPARGGAERYTVDLGMALAQRGVEVSLVAQDLRGLPEELKGVELPARSAGRLGGYSDFLGALDRHLRIASYDVVHAMLPVRGCDVYHPHAGIAAEAVRSGHLKHSGAIKRGLSRAVNQINLKRRAFVRTERRLLEQKSVPVVICLSDYVKGEVRRHYPLPEEKMVRLFNAVDLRRFDPGRVVDQRQMIRQRWGVGEDRVVMLMIAQDFARKGLRQAIEALAKLKDKRMVLVVAGKGKIALYQSMAKRLGVGDRVRFVGKTDEPAAFYAASDAFVLPTRHDPCSLVVLEALAMGLPVISTKFNGACEIMEDGRHGFVMDDPSDVEALSGAMGQLLDSGIRQTMAKACLSLRGALSQDHHVEQLMGVYERIVGMRK